MFNTLCSLASQPPLMQKARRVWVWVFVLEGAGSRDYTLKR